jgi:hypothetical protein
MNLQNNTTLTTSDFQHNSMLTNSKKDDLSDVNGAISYTLQVLEHAYFIFQTYYRQQWPFLTSMFPLQFSILRSWHG